jgi:hypothetical protein
LSGEHSADQLGFYAHANRYRLGRRAS